MRKPGDLAVFAGWHHPFCVRPPTPSPVQSALRFAQQPLCGVAGEGNALQAASVGGHDKVVRMLMDAGADVNAQGEGKYWGNILRAASVGRHDKMVQEYLADLNCKAEQAGNAGGESEGIHHQLRTHGCWLGFVTTLSSAFPFL
jgi:hypothetical protein